MDTHNTVIAPHRSLFVYSSRHVEGRRAIVRQHWAHGDAVRNARSVIDDKQPKHWKPHSQRKKAHVDPMVQAEIDARLAQEAVAQLLNPHKERPHSANVTKSSHRYGTSVSGQHSQHTSPPGSQRPQRPWSAPSVSQGPPPKMDIAQDWGSAAPPPPPPEPAPTLHVTMSLPRKPTPAPGSQPPIVAVPLHEVTTGGTHRVNMTRPTSAGGGVRKEAQPSPHDTSSSFMQVPGPRLSAAQNAVFHDFVDLLSAFSEAEVEELSKRAVKEAHERQLLRNLY